MTAPRRVFLVGPMGAGKSTVGRHLAELLAWPLVDSDSEIERRTGADIPWIFEIEGEAGFRERESQVIADLVEQEPIVIATGGGAVIREANRRYLASRGFVVYLFASLKEQVRRTARDRNRPLLNSQDRQQVLRDLMAIRDPLYREVAHLVLPTEGRSASRLAQDIVSLYQTNSNAAGSAGERG